jgi:hypothetical protein
LEGYAACSAYQGVGRALWFYHMDDQPGLIASMRRLGPFAEHAAAGVGLASVFTLPDQLPWVFDTLGRMPSEWHSALSLGLCFGLKARATTDRGPFTAKVQSLPDSMAQAISASIEACDHCEELIRRDGLPDGYRRWREAVTAWLDKNVVSPMAALNPATSLSAPAAGTAAAPQRGEQS